MTDEVKAYLSNISKEDLMKDWAGVQAEKQIEESKNKDPFWIWIKYLDNIAKGGTDKEQFAYEISSDAFRYVADTLRSGGDHPSLENVKKEVKDSFKGRYAKPLLKEYGFKSFDEVDWTFYQL